jgi:Ni/Co efflux regulator RcnB/surface antigen
MKYILTTVLALLLVGPAAAQQNDNPDRPGQSDNRKDQKGQDKKAKEQKANQQRANDQRANEQKANQQRANDQRANEQKANQQRANDQRANEQKANQQRANDQRANEQKAIEQRANDQRANEQKANQQRANDQRANEQKAIEQRANDQRANEQKANQQRANDQRANEQKAIEQRVNDQRANEQRRNIEQSAPAQQDRYREQRQVPTQTREQDRSYTREPGRDYSSGSPASRRWSHGDRLPTEYRQKQYYVSDWQQYGLRQPPRGYRWVRSDHNDFYLVVITSGLIGQVIYRDDRDREWNHRYSHYYTYDDDVYYRECRNAPDPAGVIVGALIGGLLGHAAGGHDDRGGATMAGVIIGGALGAAMTSNLDCEDRSYAYRSYYDGFNAGRPGEVYRWNNPRNDHRGEFRVERYYNDPDGFRCASFSQFVYIQGRRQEAQGVACRQPDGAWAIVNQ